MVILVHAGIIDHPVSGTAQFRMVFQVGCVVFSVDGDAVHGDQSYVFVGRIFPKVGIVDAAAEEHAAVCGDTCQEHIGLAGSIHTIDAASVPDIAESRLVGSGGGEVVDISAGGVDEGIRTGNQFVYICLIGIHHIDRAAVIRIGKIDFAVRFTESTAVIKISGSIADGCRIVFGDQHRAVAQSAHQNKQSDDRDDDDDNEDGFQGFLHRSRSPIHLIR